MRLFKLLGIAAMAAVLALPSAALAKDGGSGNGNEPGATAGTQHGRGDTAQGNDAHEAEGPEADEADEAEHGQAQGPQAEGDQAEGPNSDQAEGPQTEADQAEHGQAANPPGNDTEKAKPSKTDTIEAPKANAETQNEVNGGARVPTANAQRLLADRVASGQLSPHAAEVLSRVLQKLRFIHGAAQ